MTELILDTFRLHGALLAAGDRLTGAAGLTSARWQVLSSVARAIHPAPVAHVARDMGVTRQAVQRIADHLVADGLLSYQDNPHHKRASLVVITASGRTAFEAVTARQVPWVNALARGVANDEIAAATDVLRRLEARLNALVDEGVAPASARRSKRP